MLKFSPSELAQWVNCSWENGLPNDDLTGISTDTRTLQVDELYVALRGENFDGHDFISAAFEKGAAGALVDSSCAWTKNPILRADDTLNGLQNLARGYREKWSATVIGITGSVGKTTVKEMCAEVLSMQGKTHRTAGNFNNHIGLPLTMLRMPIDAKFGVFEIGMNHPDEIKPLAQMLQPQIGILTDLGGAHLENFASIEEIAREKAQLLAQLPRDGMAFLDADSPWFSLCRDATSARVITLSLDGKADYVGQSLGSQSLLVNGFTYPMPLPGLHIQRNVLRAIALGLELGLSPEEIATGLQNFSLPPMRWAVSTVRGIIFINDAYNANPLSMRANLQTFSEQPCVGKRWAVLGGMRELGATADAEHAALGRFVDTLHLDGVIGVGEAGQGIVCSATEHFYHCINAAEAAQILKENLAAGDAVLLKASRGERLEQVLEYFKEN